MEPERWPGPSSPEGPGRPGQWGLGWPTPALVSAVGWQALPSGHPAPGWIWPKWQEERGGQSRTDGPRAVAPLHMARVHLAPRLSCSPRLLCTPTALKVGAACSPPTGRAWRRSTSQWPTNLKRKWVTRSSIRRVLCSCLKSRRPQGPREPRKSHYLVRVIREGQGTEPLRSGPDRPIHFAFCR